MFLFCHQDHFTMQHFSEVGEMYFWDNISLSYSQPSSLFAKPWNLFWDSNTVLFNLFGELDGLIVFSLSPPSGDWFCMLSCAGSVVPEILGSLCTDSQKDCMHSVGQQVLQEPPDVEQRWRQSPASRKEHSRYQCRPGTVLEAALQKIPELLVNQWTWIQQCARAGIKANHILGYTEDCQYTHDTLWDWSQSVAGCPV